MSSLRLHSNPVDLASASRPSVDGLEGDVSRKESAAARRWSEPDLFSYQACTPDQPVETPPTVAILEAPKPTPTPAIASPVMPVFAVAPDDPPLAVALADEAFAWFRTGEKTWELRRCGRHFNENEVAPGRSVELRRGFRSDSSLRGRIEQVIQAPSVDAFFDAVSYHEVIPAAESMEEAVAIAKRLFGPGAPAPLIGFRIAIDDGWGRDGDIEVASPSLVKQ
jgi:hypothetical protein